MVKPEELMTIIMAVFLLGAVVSDLRSRVIPNLLVGAGIMTACACWFLNSGPGGLLFSLKGLGVGLLLLLIPFLAGGMGAGDVKLLGMVGAFQGPLLAAESFIWMALIGGVMAVVLLVREGRLLSALSRIGRGLVLALATRRGGALTGSARREEFGLYFPYGLAIALGALLTSWKAWW